MRVAATVNAIWSAPESRHRVSETLFWKQVEACADVEQLTALQEFGTLLVTEAQARTTAIDSKATSLLGWNAGAAAFFLAAMDGRATPYLLIPGATAAAIGCVMAFLALRVRGFVVPSQTEWIEPDCLGGVLELRRRHLLTMKRWHDADLEVNRAKASWVQRSQIGLLIATVTVCVAIAFSNLP